MAGYLDRLIERATGASPRHVPASAPVAARNVDDDPFENVAQVPPSPSPRALPREAGHVADQREVSIPLPSAIVNSFSEPPPRFEARAPAVHVEPVEHVDLPPVAPPRELRPLEIATPDPAIETRTETIVHEREIEPQIVERTALRPPTVDREVTTEKWLTPSAPGPSTPPAVPKLDEPAPRVVFVPPTPPAAAAPPPTMRPSEPASVAAPARDTRPSLTIGRLLVEVHQAAAAPAPRAVVRPYVETSSPAPTHVFHRGFGLSQS